MKKTTLESMLSYLNGGSVDVEAMRTEIQAELDRATEKARANSDLYAAAAPVVLAVVTNTEQTAKEIHAACAANLPTAPDGSTFSPNKVQYLLLHQLADKVRKIENVKGPNTYVLK